MRMRYDEDESQAGKGKSSPSHEIVHADADNYESMPCYLLVQLYLYIIQNTKCTGK